MSVIEVWFQAVLFFYISAILKDFLDIALEVFEGGLE